MSAHEFWVLVHVLLLVYWLGTDLGVFYSARYVLKPDLPLATRGTVARILLALDLSPRVCLVLTLPVGLTLAADLGLSPIHGGWLVAVWVASLAWLALVLMIVRAEEAAALRRADLAVRVTLVIALLVAAVVSLVSSGPFVTGWLAWKVIVYAIAIACGVAIRFRLAPFGPALGRLVAQGSSPNVEAALGASLRGTYPFVFTIWGALVVAAALGIAQP